MKPPVINFSTLQAAVEIAATLAFALSGLLAGARKQLDVVGLCVVAGLSAFGGGTLRDVLLDRRPFFWVEHADWLWALMGLSFAAMLFMRKRHLALTERAIQCWAWACSPPTVCCWRWTPASRPSSRC
jgi:uncharacterized membrane protein YeiH